jgi:hypothetical protein
MQLNNNTIDEKNRFQTFHSRFFLRGVISHRRLLLSKSLLKKAKQWNKIRREIEENRHRKTFIKSFIPNFQHDILSIWDSFQQ